MSLKRKNGSSLIAVLLIFAVLSISGISILSLTVSDYNARLTASKKAQSMYASDSGVNVTYGILKKVISHAIEKGNTDAGSYMNDFSQYASTKVDPLKGIYKDLYSPDGSLDTNKLKTQLNSVFQISYKKYVSDYIGSADNYLENSKYFDLANNIISVYDIIEVPNLPTITVTGKGSGFDSTTNKWEINISSKFSTTPTNGQTSNKKTVQADIVLSVPDYLDSYFVETKKQEIPINNVWKNAISIDGDMTIDSDLTVNGDTFVMGKTPVVVEGSEKVFTKYNGGISIGADNANSLAVNFNKNVVTKNSFNISGQNKIVNVLGNIYAGNVYIGNSSSAVSQDSYNCKLTVGQYDGTSKTFTDTAITGRVYTSNDVSLNATKSQINIDKYYGVNDIGSVRAVDRDYNSSSSIIVNTSDIGEIGGSSIHMSKAIINGTAYINIATPYQTGESVSIKGNYVAYTNPIPSSSGTKYDEDLVEFVYNDPLQLINNFKISPSNPTGSALTGLDKADYFTEVDKLPGITLNKSGITIDDLIFSAGVSIYGNNLMKTNNDIYQDLEIKSKQNDFAGLVYEMGDTSKILDLNYVYLQGKVNKAVFDSDGKTAQVTLDSTSDRKIIDNANSEVEVLTKNKNVVLLGNGGNQSYKLDANNEVIDLTLMASAPHGIIITTKNVILSGTVNFTGTIIAGGNLETINDGRKTLTYDDNYVLKTIGRNYVDTYSKVFNENTGMGSQIVEVSASVGKNANGSNNAIDGGLVKLNNWRINK